MTAIEGTIVGIDLGTTFSAVAYLDRTGTPVTIPNVEGDLTTPSAVLFEPGGSVVVGKAALHAAMVQPERVATCVKRDMGETFYSRIVAGMRWKPQQLSAFVLRKLLLDAQRRIGPIQGAVITVPAYFDELRRQATVDAGRIAGLNIIDIINEPTSAALAYTFRRVLEKNAGKTEAQKLAAVAETKGKSTEMVCDLGGGTFDVTIIRQSGRQVNVLATDGDLYLGGRDWDERVVNHAAKLFIEKFGVDPRQDPRCLQDLWRICEEAKKDLSYRQSTMFMISYSGNQLPVTLSREQFQEMTKDLLYRIESRLVRVLGNAKLSWENIGQTLLVGGASRMPQVGQMVKQISGREPNTSLAFDEIVAHGAVVHGEVLKAKGKLAEAMSAFAGPPPEELPSIETLGSAATAPEAFEDSAELPKAAPAEPHAEVSLAAPAVPAAQGVEEAAPTQEEHGLLDSIQAAIESPIPLLREEEPAPPPADQPGAPAASSLLNLTDSELTSILQGFTAVNVNAHSLGVLVHNEQLGREICSIIIPRNSPLPASNTKSYGTRQDDQKFIRVPVVEGESSQPEQCIRIGECIVGPLPPGLPKKSRVSVTFIYDESGRLHVTARQEDSGVTARSVIVRPLAMSGQEISKAAESVSQTEVS